MRTFFGNFPAPPIPTAEDLARWNHADKQKFMREAVLNAARSGEIANVDAILHRASDAWDKIEALKRQAP
jgi:hypothetical protein